MIGLAFGEPREGDAEYTHVDIATANELLGDDPTTDIREDVTQCIEWYRANQAWDEPLVRNS